MIQFLLSKLPQINFKINGVAIAIYLISALAIVYFGLQREISPSFLSRDVAASAGVPFYYGAFSIIGVLMWCASSVLCFFGSLVLFRLHNYSDSGFLLLAGIISLLLMIDDQFLLHETVFPFHLGVHEYSVLVLYPLLICVYFVRYYKNILSTQFLILISGLSLLAISMFADVFTHIPTFVEDGFKFVGIAGWFAYQMHTTYNLVLKGIEGIRIKEP